MADEKDRYSNKDILRYPDGYYITTWIKSRNVRFKILGPYTRKDFALIDMEVLNNKYKNGKETINRN